MSQEEEDCSNQFEAWKDCQNRQHAVAPAPAPEEIILTPEQIIENFCRGYHIARDAWYPLTEFHSLRNFADLAPRINFQDISHISWKITMRRNNELRSPIDIPAFQFNIYLKSMNTPVPLICCAFIPKDDIQIQNILHFTGLPNYDVISYQPVGALSNYDNHYHNGIHLIDTVSESEFIKDQFGQYLKNHVIREYQHSVPNSIKDPYIHDATGSAAGIVVDRGGRGGSGKRTNWGCTDTTGRRKVVSRRRRTATRRESINRRRRKKSSRRKSRRR